jgi:nitrate reductase delta subunit
MALVRFKELYSAFGFEVSDEELPDFLPTALQFAASGDFEVGMQILSEHYSGIDVLHQALVSAESPYAHITKVLLRHIPKSENADVNTNELITAGVPTELVGLEPFAIAGRGND